jgi:hypothetical protein
LTGVATSVCQSNFNDLVSEGFARELIDRGVHYLWYYIYRPVGADPSPELCLTDEQILRLRRFIVELRGRVPLLVIDAYWDHEGRALCPAAVGISHHIGPAGDIEPCPPVQFARDNVNQDGDLAATIGDSKFLDDFRNFCTEHTRGCVLLERPAELHDFMRQQQARDTSGRGAALQELATMRRRPGHHQPGKEIPEQQWIYRFAKKHWFFGFGAYG